MPHNKKDFQNSFLPEEEEIIPCSSSIIPPANIQEDSQNLFIEQEFNKIGYIDVALIEHPNHLKDQITNVEVQVNNKNEIYLQKLIVILKNIGFQLNGCMIFYQDPKCHDTFIYCGNDPLEKPIRVELPPNGHKKLTLKYRHPNGRSFAGEMKPPVNNLRRNIYQNNQPMRSNADLPKRPKERKIKEVLEYVAKWRRLYQGYYEENGTHTQLPLEVAAQRVGISKKTLDDYLLQIRFGKKFGFNFQENLNNKIGVLRTFVKRERMNEGMGRIYQRYDTQFIDSIADIINENATEIGSTTYGSAYDEKASIPDSETTTKIYGAPASTSDCVMVPVNYDDLDAYNLDQDIAMAQGELNYDIDYLMKEEDEEKNYFPMSDYYGDYYKNDSFSLIDPEN